MWEGETQEPQGARRSFLSSLLTDFNEHQQKGYVEKTFTGSSALSLVSHGQNLQSPNRTDSGYQTHSPISSPAQQAPQSPVTRTTGREGTQRPHGMLEKEKENESPENIEIASPKETQKTETSENQKDASPKEPQKTKTPEN